MAPSATETTTAPAQKTAALQLRPIESYKDLSPVKYERESEEKGTEGHNAAKVEQISIPHDWLDMLTALFTST
jgi:hypothetical protein